MVQIYFDNKFQWLGEGLNCESFAYDVLNSLGGFVVPKITTLAQE